MEKLSAYEEGYLDGYQTLIKEAGKRGVLRTGYEKLKYVPTAIKEKVKKYTHEPAFVRRGRGGAQIEEAGAGKMKETVKAGLKGTALGAGGTAAGGTALYAGTRKKKK